LILSGLVEPKMQRTLVMKALTLLDILHKNARQDVLTNKAYALERCICQILQALD
jgi:hypothetical protein